ncbi:hypothetical protein GCM10012278_30770 [Nonomuraea glycinis]|uniref:Uncharacterized protein n=1 Tax=Nonomuraea glycinis TaxID=2047744 RepID=A0A918E5Q8_9ACTN|nr:hypothetical protein GCM10012278_30770 [Nonomuraea glycinis]
MGTVEHVVALVVAGQVVRCGLEVPATFVLDLADVLEWRGCRGWTRAATRMPVGQPSAKVSGPVRSVTNAPARISPSGVIAADQVSAGTLVIAMWTGSVTSKPTLKRQSWPFSAA